MSGAPAAPDAPVGRVGPPGGRGERRPPFGRSRRRALVILLAAVIVIAIVGVVVLGGPGAPTRRVDNGAPVSYANVVRETITEQTDQSGTLGFSGSYTVSIPTGTQGSMLSQDVETLKQAETKVAADERALASAGKLARPENADTLGAARATVASDEAGLVQAKDQLVADEQLGCPPASSATVTTALGGSSSPGGSDDSSNVGAGSSSNGSPSGRMETTRDDAHAADASSPSAGAPSAQTGAVDGTSSSGTTLTGTVTPDGADTTYYFAYGTSSAFGSTTPDEDAGSGSDPVSVSVALSGLNADTTYIFALVAANSLGTSTGQATTFQTLQSSCVAQALVVTEDEQAVAQAKETLAADKLSAGSSTSQDESQLQSDELALTQAQQAYSQAQAQETNPGVRYTSLPSDGEVIHRGEAVYELDGRPVPLFYGDVTPYRALVLGVSPAADVEMLNSNLVALGYEPGPASDQFTAQTAAAVSAWQGANGLPRTGVVALGDIVIAPRALRVTSVMAADGAAAQPGSPVLQATALARQVVIQLDAALQSQIAVGDQVTITLPNNDTTPGVVSYVGKVASSSSSQANGSGSGTPTINVYITPTNPAATRTLDDASVTVAITTGRAANALVVPVSSLLALSNGGYAVEEVLPSGAHQLQAVSTGVFDDANGMVQIAGPGVYAGERIVEASGV